MYYSAPNVAESFRTKTLCSRLSLREIHFYPKWPLCVFEPTLWAYGPHTLFILCSLEKKRFWARFRRLEATYAVYRRFTEKRVVDFLLVIIKLFSIGVTAEALRANIDWKWPFLKRGGSVWSKILGKRKCPHQPVFVLENASIVHTV